MSSWMGSQVPLSKVKNSRCNMRKCLLVLLVLVVAFAGCGKFAKTFGGTITVQIDKGQKVLNASWKDSNLWVLTRPMKSDEVAERYRYREFSNLGIIQGEVVLVESK